MRRGFTLVELLVVVAIIGVLVALLLPAVQAAREAARRTTCQSHLYNQGHASWLYHDTKKEFPIGCIDCQVPPPSVPPKFTAWQTWLLPFIEQQPLFDTIRTDLAAHNTTNRPSVSQTIDIYLCPSTPDTIVASSNSLWRGAAFSDYGGLYGVEGTGNEQPDVTAQQTLRDEFLGVLVYEAAISDRTITDGTSHTAIVGEMLLRRKSGECEWANGHSLFAQEKSTPINSDSGLGNDLGSPHPGGALLTFADSHVEFITDETDPLVLSAMLTRAGND